MQKTVEIPQLQFLGLVVVPVLCTDKCWYRQCRKLWNCRRCSSCGVCGRHCDHAAFVPAVQSFDRVLDIPVVPQQFLNKVVDACAHGSDSARQFTDKVVDFPVLALTSGGASDSVIDRVQ